MNASLFFMMIAALRAIHIGSTNLFSHSSSIDKSQITSNNHKVTRKNNRVLTEVPTQSSNLYFTQMPSFAAAMPSFATAMPNFSAQMPDFQTSKVVFPAFTPLNFDHPIMPSFAQQVPNASFFDKAEAVFISVAPTTPVTPIIGQSASLGAIASESTQEIVNTEVPSSEIKAVSDGEKTSESVEVKKEVKIEANTNSSA